MKSADNEEEEESSDLNCLVCTRRFNSVKECRTHFQFCKQSFKCEKGFDQVRRYHAHVKICNGLDKYKCYICKVEFTDCKKCFDHLYQHNNKFKCMMCDFKCKSVKALQEHCDKEHPKRQCEKGNAFLCQRMDSESI